GIFETDLGATGSASVLLARGLRTAPGLDAADGQAASCCFLGSKHDGFDSSTNSPAFADDRARSATNREWHWQSQWHPNFKTRCQGGVDPSVAEPPSG